MSLFQSRRPAVSSTPEAAESSARALLGRMARGRARFVSSRLVNDAAARALRGAPVLAAEHLAAAWHELFPTDRVTTVPVADLKVSQLPAWALLDDQFVLVVALSGAAAGYVVSDGRGAERTVLGIGQSVWVPVASMRDADVKPAPKLATQAMWAAVSEHKHWFIQVGIATLLINTLSVVASLFAMQVYDRVVPNFAYSTLWVLASGVVLAMVFELAFKSIRLALQERVTRRMDDGLSRFFLERVMALRLDARPKTVGTLVAQVRDYEQVRNFLTSTTLFALADLPFALFFLLVIYSIGGIVALAPLAMIPLVLIVGFVSQRRLAHWQQQQAEESALRSGLLFEVIDGAEAVKSISAEWRFSSLWQFVTDRIAEAGMKIREISGNASHLSQLFQQMAYVGVIIAGVYQIEAGQLSMGGLIACSILAGRTLATLSGITGVLVQWQQASYSLGILNRLLANAQDGHEAQTAVSSEAVLGYRVEGVSYAYDAMVGLNLQLPKLDIAPGERVAVLGRNGSGKTTMLKLLAGLATPSAGSVRVGNVDMLQARPDWLRSVVGYLPQAPRLFAGTLRDNLALGLSMPDEADIAEAAKLTGLDALIAQHPRGLDLKITEGGLGLSVGQRQLVALTRLVLQKPRVWLLDEPASALDQDTEARLLAFLQGLGTQVTIIYTTHQNSWLRLATRVLMIDGGKIAADVPAERARLMTESQAKAMGAQAAPRTDAGSEGKP